MHFPGHRNAKHYFPVTKKATRVDAAQTGSVPRWYLVGLDDILVDIEVIGSTDVTRQLGLVPGESVQLTEDKYQRLLEYVEAERLQCRFVAGGTVANTVNNYTHLSGEPALLLGAMEDRITPGSPAFAYVAQTPKAVDLSYLRAAKGSTGTAVTFFSPDGERSFGVAPGVSGEYPADAVPEDVVRNAAVVLTSLYCLRPETRPIAQAAVQMMQMAHQFGVPVAFGLGTASLVRDKRDQVIELLQKYVTIAAMNAFEAEALTGEKDVLLSAQLLLEWVDLVIITEGPRGLTIGGYTDDRVKRQTREEVYSKSIPEYNRWEYSRLMERRDCYQPLKVYSHIHPYRGGPDQLSNTSGAGDAALAALLHDIAANKYHRATVPDSEKHTKPVKFLTYSSLSRNAQYGNRVAYEVLSARSPRLDGPVGSDDDG